MISRAVVMTAPRQVELREFEVPDAPPVGGAILKVLANGICGSDYDIYTGQADDPGHATFPMVPGHEIVGEIFAIDPQAERRWGVGVGARVAVEGLVFCGQCTQCQFGDPFKCVDFMGYSKTKITVGHGLWGGMAEYLVLQPGSRVLPIADSVSDEDAAYWNALSNSFNWGREAGGITAGDSVLVLGCGQRGLGVAAVAATLGARNIIVTGLTRDAYKLELAREFGATHTIDVETTDTVAEVLRITGGRGVDVAVDSTPRSIQATVDAVRSVRRWGTVVVAGNKGRGAAELMLDEVVLRSIRIQGAAGRTDTSTRMALDMLAEGRFPFHKLHSHTLGLDDAEYGIRLLGGEIPGEQAIHVTIAPWLPASGAVTS